MIRRILFVCSMVLLTAAVPALAQTPPTLLVLGVGEVAFDVDLPPAQASAQAYRLYAPDTATASTALTVICAAASTGTGSTCRFPLTAFTLPASPATLGFALTSVITAADGVLESSKVTAPFVLGRAVPPVPPKATAMSVRPRTP
jgi:hypothetical protein